jgi:hypothetical protein
VSDSEQTRTELEAAIRARRELGAELEPEVIASFVERIERRLDERAREARPANRPKNRSDFTLALAIVSLGVSIPLTAIAAQAADLPGIVVVWIGIVLVNVAFARRI